MRPIHKTSGFVALLAFLLVTVSGFLEEERTYFNPSAKPIPAGSKIHIAAIPGGFENYRVAGILKKKVPVVVVSGRSKADCEVSGVSASEKAGWANMLFMDSDASRQQASIRTVDQKTGEVVFAYSVHKGNSARGEQSAAEVRAETSVQMAMALAYRVLGNGRDPARCFSRTLESDLSSDAAQEGFGLLAGSTTAQGFSGANLPPTPKPQSLAVEARVRNGYFEVPRLGVWKRFYIAGINLSPAQPGHFATEAPTSAATYLEWFAEIGFMGADTIRVYTLLPPAFYQALRTYNASHPANPLYLFQEIWFDDPPQGDLFNQGFTAGFVEELKGVIDAVHGQANIPVRPGHAEGIYTADVSPYVLGLLIGREIEPHVVTITNQNNPETQSFQGRYLRVAQGSPSEVWLAKMCDQAVEYEVSRFNTERPVAFVNWPPLDPLTHPSVAPIREGHRMPEELELSFPPLSSSVPDTDDGVSLDEEHISPQPDYTAGYFALYHVYPFNPDFIFLDPAYRQAKDKEGVNSYWGYLLDLKKHFRTTPVVIGEYGLSTSIGTAHIALNGWNHGGLSEEQQAAGLVRLTGNIRDAGYAGGLIFEWIDEWWKHSWIANDFEKPFERNALWHNDLDPEQFFGLVKFVPPGPLSYVPIATADSVPRPLGSNPQPGELPRITGIYQSYDPSALYLNLCLDRTTKSEPDWSKGRYVIALNTCDASCGAEQLPVPGRLRVAQGANFIVDLRGPQASRMLIAHNYNPWRRTLVGQAANATEIGILRNMRSALDPDARFEHEIVVTNPRRYAADGTMYPEMNTDRSFLKHGNFELGSPDYSSLGQWYYDQRSGCIRLRLSWGLLLALDPSQGLFFWGTDNNGNPTGRISHSIQIIVVSFTESDDEGAGVSSQIMATSVSGGVLVKRWSMPWPTWYAVKYKSAFKKSYRALSERFRELTGYGTAGREANE